MTNIDTEHLYLDSGIMHERVHDLKSRNQKPEYLEIRTVDSESRDVSYLLGKVECLDVPFEDADVAEDRVELWVCSCPAYFFQESDGLETGERKPSEVGMCKHLRSSVRAEKAKADENQREL